MSRRKGVVTPVQVGDPESDLNYTEAYNDMLQQLKSAAQAEEQEEGACEYCLKIFPVDQLTFWQGHQSCSDCGHPSEREKQKRAMVQEELAKQDRRVMRNKLLNLAKREAVSNSRIEALVAGISEYHDGISNLAMQFCQDFQEMRVKRPASIQLINGYLGVFKLFALADAQKIDAAGDAEEMSDEELMKGITSLAAEVIDAEFTKRDQDEGVKKLELEAADTAEDDGEADEDQPPEDALEDGDVTG